MQTEKTAFYFFLFLALLASAQKERVFGVSTKGLPVIHPTNRVKLQAKLSLCSWKMGRNLKH